MGLERGCHEVGRVHEESDGGIDRQSGTDMVSIKGRIGFGLWLTDNIRGDAS